MTLDKLLTLIAEDISARLSTMTEGMAAFISLHTHAPGIAALIRESAADPFFNNKNLDAFYERIRQFFPGDLNLIHNHTTKCGARW